MLTVHHLQISQSERVVWLCEELGLDYKLIIYQRDPKTFMAPPALKQIPGNHLEAAPVIQDGDLTLGESGAILEYIIHKHGNGRFALPPSHPSYADYLYWLHFANGNLQSTNMQRLYLKFAGIAPDAGVRQSVDHRFNRLLRTMDDRLKDVPYLAGEEFTAADIMNVFTLTTFRYFLQFSLGDYANILAYLKRIGEREGYQRSTEKGESGRDRVLGAESPANPLV